MQVLHTDSATSTTKTRLSGMPEILRVAAKETAAKKEN